MSRVNYLKGVMVSGQEIDRITADILANDLRQTPIVGEDVFISQVIPLLQRPWNDKNLQLYTRFVVELTAPLRVAGVRNGETIVLFTVPPLSAAVDTSMARIQDITVAHLVKEAAILRERGTTEPVEQYITEYLNSISQLESIEHRILLPIIAILGVYDKTLLDDDGTPLYTLDGLGVKSNNPTSVSTTDTFVSTRYLDED